MSLIQKIRQLRKDLDGAGLLVLRRSTDGAVQVLLGRRVRKFRRGRLANPWGRREHGESRKECAVREAAEEVGDWIRSASVTGWRRLWCPGIVSYTCGLVVLDEKVQPPDVFTCHELTELGWYSLSDLLQQKKEIFPITRHWLSRFGVYRSMR